MISRHISSLHHRQQGLILPLTLIILAILTIMGSLLLQRNHQLIEQVELRRDQWQARLAIHNAEQRVMLTLLVGDQEPGAYRLGDVQLRTDGTPLKLSNDVWVSVQDQAGLLSLRYQRADAIRMLVRSFVSEPQASNITQGILTFQRPATGEVPLNQQHAPREALMRSLDELMLIDGITPQWYNGRRNLRPLDEYPEDAERLQILQQWQPLPDVGLRDLFTLTGSSYINYATVPEALLRRIYRATDADIERLNRLKGQSNWSGVASTLTDLGLVGELQLTPSSRYIIRYQFGDIQARGDYQVRSTTLPPRKRSWYFPDRYRYFNHHKE
ncbi:S-protein secretion component K [Vibrio metschnikovii]|uniref:S-protein secretion component K n=1 Tax=Vibrio metschnikovii TaxID=28172 RepID=UPI002FC8237C